MYRHIFIEGVAEIVVESIGNRARDEVFQELLEGSGEEVDAPCDLVPPGDVSPVALRSAGALGLSQALFWRGVVNVSSIPELPEEQLRLQMEVEEIDIL